MNTLESPQLMGLKVTLTGGRVLSVVPVSGQAPEEALEQKTASQTARRFTGGGEGN